MKYLLLLLVFLSPMVMNSQGITITKEYVDNGDSIIRYDYIVTGESVIGLDLYMVNSITFVNPKIIHNCRFFTIGTNEMTYGKKFMTFADSDDQDGFIRFPNTRKDDDNFVITNISIPKIEDSWLYMYCADHLYNKTNKQK